MQITEKSKALIKLCKDLAVEMETSPLACLEELDEDWGYENYSAAKAYLIDELMEEIK